MMPFISVVVCTLDRGDDLLRTLRYFVDESYKPFEVIVVDQSEHVPGHVQSFLDDHRELFRVIRPKEKSLPKSRNLGIDDARGEILVFVDDDVEILPGFLSAHAKAFGDDLGVWGVTGPCFDPEGPRVFTPDGVDVSWMPGCNMSIRRSAVNKVGRFDPTLEVHCDDSEMSHRIREAGGRLRYTPTAQLIHHQRRTGGTRTDAVYSATYVRKYVRSAVYFDLILGDGAEHNGTLRLLRTLMFSRMGYQTGRLGLRQFVAFWQGVADARRTYRSRGLSFPATK